jgi:release factor glutamine methyltransferase
MSIGEWQRYAENILKTAGILSAHLDSLLLLEFILNTKKEHLLAHPELHISSKDISKLNKLLTLRENHMPIAYIRGYVEFYGHKFVINSSVLVPRPESEAMLELLDTVLVDNKYTSKNLNLNIEPNIPISIADIGSGSGCLGISAKLEHPECLVDCYDINDNALKVTQTNVDLFTLNIRVMESDLINSLIQDYDILLCNLPYIPDTYPINEPAKYEPKIALFGGKDGLNLYRELFNQIKKHKHNPLYILFESFPVQQDEIANIASESKYKLVETLDYASLFIYTN